MASTSTIQPVLAASLAASLASPALAVSFNLGALEGQLDSELALRARWATDSAARELIGVANGGTAPAASGDDGRLNFKRGETFSKRFSGWHGLELKSGERGLYLSGRYWYDIELEDEARSFAAIDDHGRARGAQAAGSELLEAFVWRQHVVAGQPGSLRLGRQLLFWGEGVLIPGGIDAINPFDAAIWRQPAAPLREGRLPVNLLHAAQELNDALSLEAFYQLEWRPTTLDDCATFLAPGDYQAAGCDRLARPGGAPLPRGADREPGDGGQYGLALRYHHAPLDTDFAAYVLEYHSRLPLTGLDADGYFLAWPEGIRLYGLSFATTLAGGSLWRGELSHRPHAPLQPALGDALAGGQAQAAWQRAGVSQLQSSLEHHFDGVMGASRLTLTGELAWIHVGELAGRHGRDPLFGPGPQAGGCALPAGATGRYCENAGFTSRDAWGYSLQARWEYPRAFAGLDLAPSLSWAHDVDGHSPAPEAVFVEGRQALTLGIAAAYRDSYSVSLNWTDYSGGRYSTQVDRDQIGLELGLRF
ncbi:DUF1302 domain-containing protein [Pseudomonas oryzae]|uniref:DUF1302 domain-containing protein n=1 Tax=Pseudomonas oryzae TaxID=1392877 RepID=A0A1H1VP68_9PSED|nr:DUF1302 domain-containing protein [Pseudomonas oryzae]SDS86290.1 Protein of unknown function [Pseudomonas oryzae]